MNKFPTLLLLAILLVAFALFATQEGKAGLEHNVTGWAWSENIGWISFNSINQGTGQSYGVDIDHATGLFSGYAWSEHIGWVSFQEADLAGCPLGECKAVLDFGSGNVLGWAKVLAAQDGWDGFIHLRGQTVPPPGPPAEYGVFWNSSTAEFEGWAWGSDVVGWISFNCNNQSACGKSDYKVKAELDITPPVVVIDLQDGTGTTITEANQEGQATNSEVYIYVGDSTDDTGITKVRFSSDDTQNGAPEGVWTDWEQWDTSVGDWDAGIKRRAWRFATSGTKEIWVEMKDSAGNTSQENANFYVNITPSSSIYRWDGSSYVPDQDGTPEKEDLGTNWKNTTFTRYIFDQDTDGSLSGCSWLATDVGEASRTPCSNGSFNSLNVTVGPGQACATQGLNQCALLTRNTDNDGSIAEFAASTYSADWEDPDITNDPRFEQSGSTGTFSVTASDNIELNYCWLYDSTSTTSYSLAFYESSCNVGSELDACPEGTDCKACRDMDFAPLQGHDLQVICSDQFDMETTLVTESATYLNTTSLGIESLFVTLSADPASGTTNTQFDLSSQVSGTATGNVNLKFDCTNDGSWEYEINNMDLSTSDPGWVTRQGKQTKRTAPDTFAVRDLCQYGSVDTYTANTQAVRGVSTATDTVDIAVSANTNPQATNLQHNNDTADYCFVSSPPITLSWTFSDPDPGSSQSAYQVQVATNPGFGSPVIDTGKVTSANSEYSPLSLSYNTTYHWRVKVWDNHDDPSIPEWATGPSFTTPVHAYPTPDFNWFPTFPSAEEQITFCSRDDGSELCDINYTAFASGSTEQTFSWDFDASDGIQQESTQANSVHTYAENGAYTVTLTAGDDAGLCQEQKTVNTTLPFPEWQEISPF